MTPEISTALALCRAAFAAQPDAKYAWCCHHEVLSERLTETPETRIAYILSHKPEHEQATRFNNFRPVKNEPALATLYADYDAKCATLYADYNTKRAPLDADYNTKLAPLDADYNTKRAALYADYNTKRAALYAQDVPLGTRGGKSIF